MVLPSQLTDGSVNVFSEKRALMEIAGRANKPMPAGLMVVAAGSSERAIAAPPIAAGRAERPEKLNRKFLKLNKFSGRLSAGDSWQSASEKKSVKTMPAKTSHLFTPKICFTHPLYFNFMVLKH